MRACERLALSLLAWLLLSVFGGVAAFLFLSSLAAHSLRLCCDTLVGLGKVLGDSAGTAPSVPLPTDKMTSMQLFGKMEVQAIHMKPQSSGMTGMMEGDEDLMSKAWATTPLAACPKCRT